MCTFTKLSWNKKTRRSSESITISAFLKALQTESTKTYSKNALFIYGNNVNRSWNGHKAYLLLTQN